MAETIPQAGHLISRVSYDVRNSRETIESLRCRLSSSLGIKARLLPDMLWRKGVEDNSKPPHEGFLAKRVETHPARIM